MRAARPPSLSPEPSANTPLLAAAGTGAGRGAAAGEGGAAGTAGQTQGTEAAGKTTTQRTPRRKEGLGTVGGVFAPNVVSMFGVICFLRIGWTVGQVGFLGAVLLTASCSVLCTLTVLSLSSIATNGRVSGGGVYFLTSRTLGPEFGGAIGFVFFAASVVSSALCFKGFAEQFISTFDVLLDWPPYWAELAVATVALYVSVLLNAVDVRHLTRLNFATFVFMLATIATCAACVLLSGFIGKSSGDEGPDVGGHGFSWKMVKENFSRYGGLLPFVDQRGHRYLRPMPTCGPRGAVVSETGGSVNAVPSVPKVFAVLFNGFTGFTSGTNMSGDLRDPSHSIPKGTIQSLAFVVATYVFLMFIFNGVYTRASLVCNTLVLPNAIPLESMRLLVNAAILLASLFGANNSVAGASRVWSALMADDVLGVANHGTRQTRSNSLAAPSFSLALCTICTQACLFVGNLDALAPISTLCFLSTYAVLNLACFTLRITSSPNFRPAFRFFSWQSSIAGVVLSISSMVLIDAVVSLIVLLTIFACFYLLVMRSPPKKWGSIHQALIFQQVRKYLLRLESPTETHVKFWRPGVLLLTNGLLDSAGEPLSEAAALPTVDSYGALADAELGSSTRLMADGVAASAVKLADELKKGGMYVIGHVSGTLPDATSALRHLTRVVHTLRVKAFPQVTVATGEERFLTGALNIMLGARLGHLRPHTLMCRFAPSSDDASPGRLRRADYVRLASDALHLGNHILLVKGLEHLKAPTRGGFSASAPRFDVYFDNSTDSLDAGDAASCAGLSASFSLALVNAYVLTRSVRWRHARLRVVVLVADDGGSAAATEQAVARRVMAVRTLTRDLRIDADVVARVVAPGLQMPFPYATDVQRWSAGSSLAFVPVPQTVLNEGEEWIARMDGPLPSENAPNGCAVPCVFSIGAHVVLTTEL